MTVENTGVALARQATEALRHLDDHGRTLRPDGTDHFTWSADVLDELARLAEVLGRAVERVSGEDAPEAESHARTARLAGLPASSGQVLPRWEAPNAFAVAG